MIRRISIKCVLMLLFVAAAATCVFAAGLDDYRKRVDSARAGINTLLDNISQAEIGEEPSEPDAEVFAYIRRLMPGSEAIDTPKGAVETDNAWFAEALRTAEAEEDLSRRAVMLSDLDERLAALSAEIAELQIATASARS